MPGRDWLSTHGDRFSIRIAAGIVGGAFGQLSLAHALGGAWVRWSSASDQRAVNACAEN